MPFKQSSFIKYLKRALFGVIVLFILLIGTGFFIAYFYENKVKDFFIKELNKHLNTEISVEDIKLSLIKKFPNASLEFIGVVAKDAILSTPKDTLLKAKNIYLQFSIWDLIDKNYCIKKIELHKAAINILVFKNGTDNYHFWKSSPDSANTSFSFDIQEFEFNDVICSYKNYDAKQDYSFIAKDVILTGKFSNEEYSLYTKGDIHINYIRTFDINYFADKDAYLKFTLHVNQQNQTYRIDKGVLDVGELSFDVRGDVIYKEFLKDVDIRVKGKNLELNSFIQELPNEYKKYLANYKSNGDFYFNTTIKGRFDGNNLPLVTAEFGIKNAEIIQRSSSIALENLSFNGEYTNGSKKNLRSNVLKIDNFSTTLKSGIIKGNLQIKNFISPEIRFTTTAELDFADLIQFIKFDTISSINGRLRLSITFEGILSNTGKFTIQDFVASRASGDVNVINTSFRIKDDVLTYDNFNGYFIFNNNDIIIKDLNGQVSGNDFNMKGHFRNILPYLFLPNQQLQIDAVLLCNNMNIDKLLTSNSSAKDFSYKLVFPSDIAFNLDIDIRKFNFKKFKATNLTGKIKLNNRKLLFDPVSFSSMDGNVSGYGMIDGTRKEELLISCNASIYKVDISQLFYEFGNFGQESMKSDNISGVVTSEVKFVSVWSTDLKADLDKIYTKADIIIEKGRLINYTPIQRLSKFLKIDDLSNVQFSTLYNQIEIRDQKIFIPEMEIKSNALNIEAYGVHTFNNELDYHLKILLSELLSNKARKAKKENEEFGVVEDDGLGKTTLYILVTGTVDDPIFKYDKQQLKDKIKTEFIKEKQIIKQILNGEFGWFKKDTTLHKSTEDPKDHKFIIEWNEDEGESDDE